MKLAFEPIWPWPFVLLTCAVMLFVLRVGYPRRIRHLSVFWRRLLIGLRVAIVLLITFWLLRPAAILESNDRSNAVLYVVMDGSRSMETPDGAGGMTRRQELLQLYEAAKPFLDVIDESVEVRLRDLAEDLTVIEAPGAAADGRMTAIGANLETLAKEAARERIAAILFWSDGKQAASSKKDVDPIQAARLSGRQNSPIYTVVMGSSDVETTTLDLAVSELDIARDVFIRNVVPIKVRLKSFGAEGRDCRVRVLVEDRAQLPNGTTGEMLAVRPSQDNITLKVHRPADTTEDVTLDLQFVPLHAGEIKVAVEVEVLDDEVRRTNNRVETIIRVRSGGIRVAYFDRLRPEYKWLRRINVSSRVQLDHMHLYPAEFANRNDFNDDWFIPGNYDAFIIGDVPADLFGEERLKKLHACCELGAGLMMIGGEDSFGGGGYHRTPLAQLLPVSMSDADQQLTDDIQMMPRRAAFNNPILQIAPPDQNRQRWTELPPLTGANALRVRDGGAAVVLAESPTGMPLLIGQNVGASRVLAFAGDTTWQWAVDEDWAVEAHQRFWRQIIFWLTKMENDGDSKLWISVEPRDVVPGSLAELSFGLRDDDGIPLAGVKYDVTVQRPDGDQEVIAARAVDTHGAGDFQNTMDPGDYWGTVAAEDADGGMNYATTRFLVNPRDPELDNPAADPSLMRELAHVSAGDFLTSDDMLKRLERWADEGLPSLEVKRSERITLWDNWISLLLFVLLLCIEWACRKKRGLV
ncbi:MAG TPA: hypothetical protein EYG03_18790 [Planctomycetes bacterium]|nr:hypothetical protein [Fuerstiella sp.]HIK93998.1 hypothetical protein [Planctomycetota bacterium]